MKTCTSFIVCLLILEVNSAVPCDHQDALKSMECKPLLGELSIEMAEHADMPPPDELKKFDAMCQKALKCMETIKCDLLQNATILISKTCTGINLMSGPFGKCIEKLRDKPASLKKYPCGRFLQSEKGRPGNCQMYQDEVKCTRKLIIDRCDREAEKSMDRNLDYILRMMECEKME